MMSEMPYTILETVKPDVGQGARIALCDTFAQVAQAHKDGCDAALLHNEQTQAWMGQMKMHLAQVNDNGSLWSRLCLQFIAWQVQHAFGGHSQFRGVVSDLSDKGGYFHSDVNPLDTATTIFTTAPTSLILTQKPVMDALSDEGLETKGGFLSLYNLDRTSFAGAPFSPIEGTVVFLFNSLIDEEGAGWTLGHSAPDRNEAGGIENRASVLFDTSMKRR